MTKLGWLGVLLSFFLLVAPAGAQDNAAAPEWQTAISGQVEAFREHDGAKALSFAASGFKQTFADPAAFLKAIADWGYEPIVESRSHSFGPFKQVDDVTVLQQVRFTGPDSVLYEAVYQMLKEADGWKVGSVQMVKTAGMSA